MWIVKKKPFKHCVYANNMVSSIYQISLNIFYNNSDSYKSLILKNSINKIKDMKSTVNSIIYNITLKNGITKKLKHTKYYKTIDNEEFEYNLVRETEIIS